MKKYQKQINSALVLFLLVLNIALTITFFLTRGIGNLPPFSVINITFDLCGMGVSFFLSLSVIVDDSKFTRNAKFFLMLTFSIALNLFFDSCCWLTDGIPSLNFFNYVSNMFYYIMGDVFALIFWAYVKYTLNRTDAFANYFSKIASFLFIFIFVFTLINPLHNLLFYVSEDGYYHRTSAFFISYIFPALTFLVSCYLIISSKAVLRKKLALISFLILPAIGFAISSFEYGLSVGYPTVMCSIILLYGSFYTEKGYTNAVESVEHEHATDIQTSILNKTFINEEHFSVYGKITPSADVTGDFYDFVRMDKEHIIFGVGTTSGKGISASLFMMKALLILRASSASSNIAEAITSANNLICEKNNTTMHVNSWLGVVNTRTGNMHFINAGSKPPILIRDRTASYIKSPPNNSLGVRPGIEYTAHNATLKKGDIILMYTDGVADVICGTEPNYNEDKLLSLLNISNESAKKACETVDAELTKFLEKNEALKDVTVFAFKYHG